MTEHLPASFDAYHRWLGIPPQEQPANHYRLLNLSLFESDPEVIRGGAERQMAYVRNHQLGQYADLTQKILNELGAAKACLLDPGKREAYDAALRQQLEGQARDVEGPLDAAEPDPISAALAAPSESAPADTESRSQTGNRPQNLGKIIGIVAGGAADSRGALNGSSFTRAYRFAPIAEDFRVPPKHSLQLPAVALTSLRSCNRKPHCGIFCQWLGCMASGEGDLYLGKRSRWSNCWLSSRSSRFWRRCCCRRSIRPN